MRASDFDEGDNFNTPFISGYETLFYHIMDDMKTNPEAYKPWERAFVCEMPSGLYAEYDSDMRSFIDQWCEERTPDHAEMY